MKHPGPYVIVSDDDTHNFVIPVSKQEEWSNWCEAVSDYWHSLPEDREAPEQPDWADPINGSPCKVEFDSYVIK